MALYTTVTSMALYRHKTWLWVQNSVDFQVDVSILGGWKFPAAQEFLLLSQDEKETASSRGIVLREAAHTEASMRDLCVLDESMENKN